MQPEFELTLTDKEYSALNDLFGPPEAVFDMVMQAIPSSKNRWVLSGEFSDYDELWGFLEEDLMAGMSKKKHCPHLLSTMEKIEVEIWDGIEEEEAPNEIHSIET